MGPASHDLARDPAEAVALIATERRSRLLRVYRRRLRWEDLEDCYSQATLELVARSRRAPFVSSAHVLNALEQKFLSRIDDRRRALGGRSAIESAIARAVPVDPTEPGAAELEDRAAGVERQVFARTELSRVREVIADLSRDQQLVLASQICVEMSPSEFCLNYGWSLEKYRKVAQRARARLRLLLEEYERGERCTRLEPDILATVAGVAEPGGAARARAHLDNCRSCARGVAARRPRAALPALAVVPAAIWMRLRRGLAAMRALVTGGGSLAGAGAAKIGIAAVCVAGAAGGYAVCTHLGVIAPLRVGGTAPRAIRRIHTHRAPLDHAALRPEHTATALAPDTPEPAHLSAVAQIEREFGTPPAHASSSAAGEAASIAQIRREFGTARARSAATSANHSAVAQVRREFGATTAAHAASSTNAAASQVQRELGSGPPATSAQSHRVSSPSRASALRGGFER